MKKKLFIGFFLFFIFGLVFVGLFVGGIVFASQSNSDIPVFSDLAESIESSSVSNEALKAELKQNTLDDVLISLTNASDDQSVIKEVLNIDVDEDLDTEAKFDSFKYEGTMNMSTQEADIDLDLEGKAKTKTENFANEANINMAISISGFSVDFGLDFKQMKNEQYVRINEMPALFSSQISTMKDQWIKLEADDASSSSSLLGLGDKSQNEEQKQKQKLDIAKFNKVLSSDVVVENTELIEDQIIKDVRTKCIRTSLDNKALKELENEIIKQYENEEDVEDIDLSKMENLEVEICVGRGDNLPYKFILKTEMNVESNEMSDIDVDFTFYDYNKDDFSIEAPQDYTTMKEIEEKQRKDRLNGLDQYPGVY